LKDRYEKKLDLTVRTLERVGEQETIPPIILQFRQLQLDLIGLQRAELARMRHRNEFPEELIRSEEFEMDLEEARIRRIKMLS